MSATPEQIAERLDELARNFLASAAANLKEGFPSAAKGQEVLGTAFTDAVGAIRAQSERVRVLESELRALRIKSLCLCSYAERIRPYVVMSEDGDAMEAKLLQAADDVRAALKAAP